MLIEVLEGRVRGIVLLPETVLTKSCTVSSGSGLEEMRLEMLAERCIVAVGEGAAGGGDDRAGETGQGRRGQWR